MSMYSKSMGKRFNQKEDTQAYPYPSPNASMNGRNEGAMRQDGGYPASPTPQAMGKYGSPQNFSPKMMGNKKKVGGFSHKAPALPTDLHCYFQCSETFKKDYDLRLHLKLRHKNEHPDELVKAEEAAEEEISFVSRSGSRFQCALCNKMFSNDNTMYAHATNAHGMSWMEYKDKYGRSEVESSPFECKICGKVVKYTPNIVHSHLKGVHGLDWVKYLDRIRKLARGEQPDELPQIKTYECKICNMSVKYFTDHLKSAHKITSADYKELFSE